MITRNLSNSAATAAILALALIATWRLPQAFSQFQSDSAADNAPFNTTATIAAAETADDVASGNAGPPQWDVTITSDDSDYDAIPRSQEELVLRARLAEPVELQYLEVPLDEVAEDLSRRLDMHIEIDVHTLQDLGIDVGTAVTADYRGVSLRSALDLLLDKLDLTYIIEREYLLITTNEAAVRRLDTRV